MQLTAGITPALIFSFLGFVVSLESFLAFSGIPAMKVASCLLFLGCLLVVAIQHWDRGMGTSTVLFAIFFGVYLGSAASRYPGLIKEPTPYLFADVFRLVAKGSITMMTSFVVARLLWIAARRLYFRIRGQVVR